MRVSGRNVSVPLPPEFFFIDSAEETTTDHPRVIPNCRISVYQRQADYRVSPYPGTVSVLVIPPWRRIN